MCVCICLWMTVSAGVCLDVSPVPMCVCECRGFYRSCNPCLRSDSRTEACSDLPTSNRGVTKRIIKTHSHIYTLTDSQTARQTDSATNTPRHTDSHRLSNLHRDSTHIDRDSDTGLTDRHRDTQTPKQTH